MIVVPKLDPTKIFSLSVNIQHQHCSIEELLKISSSISKLEIDSLTYTQTSPPVLFFLFDRYSGFIEFLTVKIKLR